VFAIEFFILHGISWIEMRSNNTYGWYQVRMRGSHRQFNHPNKTGTVTVSGKLNIDIPPGTLNSIFKQAGLK
jgi:predicted RNA binding protein YcfA (HicA-like mRNA interferase family)